MHLIYMMRLALQNLDKKTMHCVVKEREIEKERLCELVTVLR